LNGIKLSRWPYVLCLALFFLVSVLNSPSFFWYLIKNDLDFKQCLNDSNCSNTLSYCEVHSYLFETMSGRAINGSLIFIRDILTLLIQSFFSIILLFYFRKFLLLKSLHLNYSNTYGNYGTRSKRSNSVTEEGATYIQNRSRRSRAVKRRQSFLLDNKLSSFTVHLSLLSILLHLCTLTNSVLIVYFNGWLSNSFYLCSLIFILVKLLLDSFIFFNLIKKY
jgi:hypothetical protein